MNCCAGVLLVEMWSQERAWGGARSSQIIYWVTSLNQQLEVPEGAPPEYKARPLLLRPLCSCLLLHLGPVHAHAWLGGFSARRRGGLRASCCAE